MARWTAPEILDYETSQATESKQADVYAFGMVAVEAFTGKVPFHEKFVVDAMNCILEGKVPRNHGDKPLTDEMWNFLERCWEKDPQKRPVIEKVVEEWQKFPADTTMEDGGPQLPLTAESNMVSKVLLLF